MRNKAIASTMLGMALTFPLLAPLAAEAHVGISNKYAVANATQEITFGVGHGCEGSDTYRLTIDIPAGVTSVRAVPSAFGKVTVNRDATDAVVSVTWQKADADVLPNDPNYYPLSLRLKVPNAPFTTLHFPTHQTCRKADGTLLPVVDWVGTVHVEGENTGMPEPAPAVVVLPERKAGWNKYVIPVALTDLNPYFADAQIVWKGTSAFSANAATADQIKTTAGVTPLTTLAAGDEIWVKY